MIHIEALKNSDFLPDMSKKSSEASDRLQGARAGKADDLIVA